jgi:hypothetical protein
MPNPAESPARTHTDLTKEECDDAGRDPDVGSRHAQEALEALGPISQRARLGTVREDYSAYGSAWEYLPPGANHQTGWTGLVIELMQLRWRAGEEKASVPATGLERASGCFERP